MKKFFIFLILSGMFFSVTAQTTHTVTYSGYTFTPDLVTCKVGDIVRFNVSTAHPVVQVSQTTWDANGNSALSGGFSYPTGAGDYIANAIGTLYYVCIPHASFGMKGKIIVEGATGLPGIMEIEDLSIYPNPVEDNLNISFSDNLTIDEIRIFDVTGRSIYQVRQPAISNKVLHLDLSMLNHGIYFISMTSENKKISHKFLKL